VPEPELALLISSRGQVAGYTIGNDMSSRDIEGENPLYLPQAKTFDGCVALGPALLISADPLPVETRIELEIRRDGRAVVDDATTLAQLRRSPASLVEFLFREASLKETNYGVGYLIDNRPTSQIALSTPTISSSSWIENWPSGSS
jgi:2-dehydro-3-deoxy-D-arabinonate dehydratase